MILSDSIELRFSGGSLNMDPELSIGGGISNTKVTANIFSNLVVEEAPDSEYKCIYVINVSQTPIPKLKFHFGQPEIIRTKSQLLVSAHNGGKNTEAESVLNKNTAPTDQIFTRCPNSPEALILRDLLPGDYWALWINRNLNKNIGPHRDAVKLVFVL